VQLRARAIEIKGDGEQQGTRPGIDGIELKRGAAADDVGDQPMTNQAIVMGPPS
jgi:hypothetical protein